jgi:hypothetical protein
MLRVVIHLLLNQKIKPQRGWDLARVTCKSMVVLEQDFLLPKPGLPWPVLLTS